MTTSYILFQNHFFVLKSQQFMLKNVLVINFYHTIIFTNFLFLHHYLRLFITFYLLFHYLINGLHLTNFL